MNVVLYDHNQLGSAQRLVSEERVVRQSTETSGSAFATIVIGLAFCFFGGVFLYLSLPHLGGETVMGTVVEGDPDFWNPVVFADETWDYVVEFADPADGRIRRVAAESLFQFPDPGETVRVSVPDGRPQDARPLVAPAWEIALYVVVVALGVVTIVFGRRDPTSKPQG